MRLPLMLLSKDLWERHYLVAKYLRQHRIEQGFDVGGEGLLGRFLPGVWIVSLNVDEDGDCRYDGQTIPFADDTCDAVVCLDVLEHITPSQRQAFVDELFRVSKQHVVLALPLGSPLHTELEREALALWREQRGEDHPYLAEHVANGLPTLDELRSLLRGRCAEMSFVGSCRDAYDAFCRSLRADPSFVEGLPILGRVVRGLRSANWGRVPEVHDTPRADTNRVYVWATKTELLR